MIEDLREETVPLVQAYTDATQRLGAGGSPSTWQSSTRSDAHLGPAYSARSSHECLIMIL